MYNVVSVNQLRAYKMDFLILLIIAFSPFILAYTIIGLSELYGYFTE